MTQTPKPAGPKPPPPMEPIYLAIGAKIVMMRTALGLTQEDISKRIGLTRASIANIETGRQRILLHDLERIANAFNTTPKHMLRGIWL
jgi:transcriptional regulator with XRE-family HTH domain